MPERRVQPAVARLVLLVLAAAAALALAAGPAAAVDESPPFLVTGGNTPAVRLQQDTSSGFPPQMWDVAGNESSFFVRDTTHGLRLPFRIGAGAPTHSLLIEPNGNVGVGAKVAGDAAVPTPTSLYVYRSDGTARLTVEEGNGTRAARTLGELQNNGPAQLQFTDDSSDPMAWVVGNGDGHDFAIRAGTSSPATLSVAPNGDTRISGVLEQRTDGQTDIAAVDPARILTGIRSLPGFTTWRYASDPDGTRHLGPSPADFRSAVGVGPAGNVLAPSDVAGVALAGVRALADVPPGSDPRVTPLVTAVAAQKARGTGYIKRIKALESTAKKLTAANKKLSASNKKMSKTLGSVQKQVRALAHG
jgi:hypothetical protein